MNSQDLNEETHSEDAPEGMSKWKRFVLIVLVLLFVGSIGARVWAQGRAKERAEARRAAGGGTGSALVQGQGFLPGLPGGSQAETPIEEPDEVEQALPYLTEASFFGLIGFALGYAARKLVKVGLIILAIAFVGVQALTHFEIVTVDWGRAQELANQFLFNLKEHSGFTDWAKDKVPSAGSLGAGYLLGFRKG
ncbi:MAG: FUN14 domain-containing protein [Planctomycetota bacterium]